MEDIVIFDKKKWIKWATIATLAVCCLAGIIYEATIMGIGTRPIKLGIIHIAQYLVMVFCIFLPIILEKAKLSVGWIVWLAFYIFIFLAIFVGSILNVYDKLKGFDTFIHALSGIFAALLALSLAKEIKNSFVCFLFVVSIGTLVGVLWEFYEFSFDWLLDLNMQRTSNPLTGEPYLARKAILNTMLDLFADFAGAAICGIFITIFRKRAGKSFLIEKNKIN